MFTFNGMAQNSCKTRHIGGSQTVGRDLPVDRGQLFGLYQNLFAASVRSIVLPLAAFFGSTFSQMKIIKSSHRNRLTDEHLKYGLH